MITKQLGYSLISVVEIELEYCNFRQKSTLVCNFVEIYNKIKNCYVEEIFLRMGS